MTFEFPIGLALLAIGVALLIIALNAPTKTVETDWCFVYNVWLPCDRVGPIYVERHPELSR